MPSERSLYRKIELVMEVASESTSDSLDDLLDEIEGRQYGSFSTRRFEIDLDDFVWRQSQRVIRRTIRWAHELGLLSDQGRPTRTGRTALRSNRFASTLARKAIDYLRAGGLELEMLNSEIVECLTGDPTVLPTARELWSRLEPEIGVGAFSRLLTLLSHSEAAISSQSKIYLQFRSP